MHQVFPKPSSIPHPVYSNIFGNYKSEERAQILQYRVELQ